MPHTMQDSVTERQAVVVVALLQALLESLLGVGSG